MKYTQLAWALWQKKEDVFTEQQFEKLWNLLISMGVGHFV
jgi:hypothetical protein